MKIISNQRKVQKLKRSFRDNSARFGVAIVRLAAKRTAVTKAKENLQFIGTCWYYN